MPIFRSMHANIFEIKATCDQHESLREVLRRHNARYIGTDHQIDTYYAVPKGRLKLRQGAIENTLIFYQRQDLASPKQSKVTLYKPVAPGELREVLDAGLEHLVTVDKQREIYFIGNVKIHLDEVKHLGQFVEIEAIDTTGNVPDADLQMQCREMMQLLGVIDADCLSVSYGDMLLNNRDA
ncbi:MAG: class IV adenylate cyclase [Gammaproteobacteria bacterium]